MNERRVMQMKTYVMALVLLSSAVWVRGAEGALKEKAREVADAFRDSVLFVTAVTEVEFSAGDSRCGRRSGRWRRWAR